MIIEMVIHFIPKFIESIEYKTWKKVIDLTDDYLSIGLMGLFEQNSSTSEFLIENREWCKELGLTYIYESYREQLTRSFYVYNFIRVAENLPISISICGVEGIDNVSFPIIYVNEMYGLMVGPNRSDILGKNFGYIKNSNRGLYDHLVNVKPYVTKLSHPDSQDGDKKYLVGIRPIVDNNNKYLYVIVIHMDIHYEDELEKAYSFMHNLILKLPRRLCSLELKPCPFSKDAMVIRSS